MVGIIKQTGTVNKNSGIFISKKMIAEIGFILVIAVIAVIVMEAFQSPTTSTGLQQKNTQQAEQAAYTGSANPSQANNAGQETIIDPYGNQVDQKDIINIGIVPVVKPIDGLPPHLVRAGIIDLQVNVESGQNIVVNLYDSPAQKETYVRVKVFDQKGVVTFSDKNVDYIELLGKKGSGVGQSIYDHNPRTLSGEIKQMQVLVYFVDNKYQSKSPPRINV